MSPPSARYELSKSAQLAVLVAAFLGLVFDGFELGLMPVAAPSVTKSLLGTDVTNALSSRELKEIVGHWFALYTASLMLGAACGGIFLGNLGDRIGRARAMGVSILFYSVFALAGAFAKSQEQMLALRFAVGLGVGGMWPNGVALVAECWRNTSRPTVSGILALGSMWGYWCFQSSAADILLRLTRGVGYLRCRQSRWCSVWRSFCSCQSHHNG